MKTSFCIFTIYDMTFITFTIYYGYLIYMTILAVFAQILGI